MQRQTIVMSDEDYKKLLDSRVAKTLPLVEKPPMSPGMKARLFAPTDRIPKCFSTQEYCKEIPYEENQDLVTKTIGKVLNVGLAALKNEFLLEKMILALAQQFDPSIAIPTNLSFVWPWRSDAIFENEGAVPDVGIQLEYRGINNATLIKITDAFNNKYGEKVVKTWGEIWGDHFSAMDGLEPKICFDMPKFFDLVINDLEKLKFEENSPRPVLP